MKRHQQNGYTFLDRIPLELYNLLMMMMMMMIVVMMIVVMMMMMMIIPKVQHSSVRNSPGLILTHDPKSHNFADGDKC